MKNFHERSRRLSLLIGGAMLSSAVGSSFLVPRTRRADSLPPLLLDSQIPKRFGSWAEMTQGGNQVIDPLTEKTIRATYTQTLSRTYRDENGRQVMLSIAYGEVLTDTGVGLHYPEVCYPAQGFEIIKNEKYILESPWGEIKSRRLSTMYAKVRKEWVTYWTMIGPQVEYGGLQRKLTEIAFGLKGIKLDGLLFRVSSVGNSAIDGFTIQERFAIELLKDVSKTVRYRLIGSNN